MSFATKLINLNLANKNPTVIFSPKNLDTFAQNW